MKYYYITGTGKGIGKALAEQILKEPDVMVYGLSRNNSIDHPNFRFIRIDLSNQNEANAFNFNQHEGAEQVSLINNAGILGPVDYTGKINTENINDVINVNFLSAFILSNSFIRKYQESTFVKVILNVSSGAGRHPFEAWSLYCSSKAALDMMSRVISEEQRTMNKDTNVLVFSVAPGIVDTDMQGEIRLSPKEQFPKRDAFIGYYENKELASSQSVAIKLKYILDCPESFQNTILDVRTI